MKKINVNIFDNVKSYPADENNSRFDKEESVVLNWESDAGLISGRFDYIWFDLNWIGLV